MELLYTEKVSYNDYKYGLSDWVVSLTSQFSNIMLLIKVQTIRHVNDYP